MYLAIFYFRNGIHTAGLVTQQPLPTPLLGCFPLSCLQDLDTCLLNVHWGYELACVNSSGRWDVSGSLECASWSAFGCLVKEINTAGSIFPSYFCSEARYDQGDEAMIFWPLAKSLREMSYHTTELFKQCQWWENELNWVFYYLQCNKS